MCSRSRFNAGISSTQGAHQVAQKLTSVTLPAKSLRLNSSPLAVLSSIARGCISLVKGLSVVSRVLFTDSVLLIAGMAIMLKVVDPARAVAN